MNKRHNLIMAIILILLLLDFIIIFMYLPNLDSIQDFVRDLKSLLSDLFLLLFDSLYRENANQKNKKNNKKNKKQEKKQKITKNEKKKQKFSKITFLFFSELNTIFIFRPPDRT